MGYWTAVAALVAAGLTAVAGMIDLWDVPAAGPAAPDRVQPGQHRDGRRCSCSPAWSGPARRSAARPVVMLAAELVALGVGAIGVCLGARLMRQFDAAPEAGGSTPTGTSRRPLGDAPPAATVEIARPRA